MNTRERRQFQGHSVAPFGPLAGVRAVECDVLLAGPFCGWLLADFGAEVVKIEPPSEGDPVRTTPLVRGSPYAWDCSQTR